MSKKSSGPTHIYSRLSILALRPPVPKKPTIEKDDYRLQRQCGILARLPTSRSIKRTDCNSTKFCLINTGSIVNKSETFATLLNDHSPDIIALTETWLTPKNGDQILTSICPQGYSSIQIPRIGRRGGGVGLVYKSTIFTERITDSPVYNSFEHIDLHLKFNLQHLRLLVIYRPPNKSASDFLHEFSTLLESVSIVRDPLLIAGDFNFHVDNASDYYGAALLSLIESFGLQQLVNGPTHERNATQERHTLDLLLVRQSDSLTSNVIIAPRVISDHNPVLCNLNLRPPRWPTKRVLTRSTKSINWDNAAVDLANLPLICSPSDTLDGLVDQYNSGLRKVFDLHAPLRERLITLRPINRWITDEVLQHRINLRKKERCWRKWQLAIDILLLPSPLQNHT